MDPRTRRDFCPGRIEFFECLETRALLTAPTFLVGQHVVRLSSPRASLAASQDPTSLSLAHLPTPREVARSAFTAKMAGSFVVGPPRFTDQKSQVFIQGAGTSTAFLHGNLLMAVYTPKVHSDSTTGTATLIVKNVSNTGNVLILDLVGSAQRVDRAGRPTTFAWTVDGASGGTFTGATGQGTAQIRYRTGGKLPTGGATSAGSVGVIFRGSIQTTGVSDILKT